MNRRPDMTDRYYLARNAFVCDASDHAVFLDLKTDRYLALSLERSRDLWTILPEVRRPQNSECIVTGHAVNLKGEAADLARELEREGLLVRDYSKGRMTVDAYLEAPQSSVHAEVIVTPDIGATYTLRFLAAWSATTAALRLLALRTIVDRVRARKRRNLHRMNGLNLGRVATLVSAYNTIQPRYFSAENACLRNSLTMIGFLSQFDVYPTWVFGVRTKPFAAHCWVQLGRTVLSDSAHHVKTFSPLLVV